MSQTIETPQDSSYQDFLVIRHPNGKSERFPGPAYEGEMLRIGRELDNEIILVDPRASRYHSEVRRTDAGGIEIRDLGSANGLIIDSEKLDSQVWHKLETGQTVQMAETRMVWEAAMASQPTVAMKPTIAPPPKVVPKVAPTPAPAESNQMVPMIVGGVVALLLLLLLAGAIYMFMGRQVPTDTASVATPLSVTTEAPAATVERTEPKLSEQAVGTIPTETPTPTGPQLAIPVVNIVLKEIRPILLGALPSTDKGLLLVTLRVQNEGNIPFTLSTSDFSLQTRDGKQTIKEAGGNTSAEGLKRLGAVDRFDNLSLTPGGSVAESLIFEVAAESYNFDLLFEPNNVEAVVLGLGQIDVANDLALALGNPTPTPIPTATTVVVTVEPDATATATTTPTAAPTATATRPPLIPAPKVVAKSSLTGKIAYATFNGNGYDLHIGQVDGSGNQFFRANASQPQFSPDGSRLVFHSWANDSRGLVTMDLAGANGKLVANFIEDQLPTWTADGQRIIFLSRRSGDRKSLLMSADANAERGEAALIGEGEYPSVAANGQMVFKGWGNTAYGLRIGGIALDNVKPLTNVDEDTAPTLSPDGKKVAFMSRREGQWDVYVINVDGSNLKRLTTDAANDGLPTWSPDGNAVAFVSNRGGPWAVWAMSPEGDGQSQLFTMEGPSDGFVGSDTYASRGWAEERISWTK